MAGQDSGRDELNAIATAAMSADSLEVLIDVMRAAVVVIDRNAKFVRWNQAASDILGLGARDVPPEQWTDTYGLYREDGEPVPTEDLPLVRALAGDSVDDQLLMIRNEQLETVRWMTVSARPLPEPSGGAVASFVDITDRIAAQRQLEEFVYLAAHDMQEPLRIVRSYVDLLATRYGDRLDGDAEKYMGFVVDGATKMQALIRDVLEFARSGSRKLSMAPVALDRILDDVLLHLGPATEEAGATIVRTALPRVRADRAALSQILTNLIGNALKFRSADRPLEISIDSENVGPMCRVTVADNGVGFDPKYQKKLFKMFQRLQNDRAGTGIGLAMCKRIAERHGGSVGANGERGRGAKFWFTVPLAPES